MGVNITVKNANYTDIGTILLGDVITNYVTATGLTDPTEIGAIEQLIFSLASNGIYKKMDAMYLFVGDTYNKVKINIVDNAAYTLDTIPEVNVSNGLDMSTLSAISTNFIGNDTWLGNGHIAAYNSTTETSNIGFLLHNAADVTKGAVLARSSQNGASIFHGLDSINIVTPINTEVGLFTSTQDADTARIYSKGVLLSSDANPKTNSATEAVTVSTNTGYKSSTTLQVVSIGALLTLSEIAAYNTACEIFTATLGR
tara:strand:+ start:110 stop:877 length:768 start_codon:yes stop_codon:yes gene_type:complete